MYNVQLKILCMYYKEPINIIDSIGNNELSYSQRKILWSNCTITVPTLMQGNFDDIKIWTDIVFEEIDHKWVLQSCRGLKNIIELNLNWTLHIVHWKIFIMDNHNHALYLRYREYLAKCFDAWATLIHIDQHADMWIPNTKIDTTQCNNLDYIATYTNEVCNVWNFIQPAIDSWLIWDVIQIRSVTKLLESSHQSLVTSNYILDIDIDFRVDHTPTKEEISAVQTLLAWASVCTIALSPYFMPIEQSIAVTKLLFS